MAKFTDQELSEKASAVYAEAEQHYKGSEITVDILMRIAKEYFDFDEDQLNQLGRYFEIEELAFIDIDDIDVEKLQYVSAEEIEAMRQGREEVKGSDLDRIEAFLLNREGYTTELADSILTQLYNTFKGLTKTEESLEEEKEVVGIDLNVKHNFCAVSNGSIYDYDRVYMKQVCEVLHKIDKIGNKNLSYKDKRRLNKLCKQNEALFKKLIHDILNDLEKQNVNAGGSGCGCCATVFSGHLFKELKTLFK